MIMLEQKNQPKQKQEGFRMENHTTLTYQMKRDILHYARQISSRTQKDIRKFAADMTYGILGSKGCVLSQIADILDEDIIKKNTIERLSRKLAQGIPETLKENYLRFVLKMLPENAVVHVDESEVIKPYGKKFEALGIVRDGSSPDHDLETGYHVTEITALTAGNSQPVSLYSHIHSSNEENFVSVNDITFRALSEAFDLLPGATYVLDRGYDMNKMFDFMYRNDKQFVIRIKENRLLFYKGKWFKAPVLRDSHKGKIKTNVIFDRKETECWISCVNVKITAGRRPMKLILVYGLGDVPMMLATNRSIKCKDDAIRVMRLYFSRWRIEEYFRFKKQHFGFENFRVRSLIAINALNFFLSCAIGYLGMLAEKRESASLRQAIIRQANALRQNVSFLLYRIGLGVSRLIAHAWRGIRQWFRIGRPKFRQLNFFRLC